ncbi:MAG: hypothetical protein NC300_05595 [Bacteroidales bacterium]|nr:hypothetical protein [Clostridium sp.]MCM1203596.1 hypothetical protein [Bacteroidales bacterium]
MQKLNYTKFTIALFLTITLIGILLPGILLRNIFEAHLGTVKPAPEKYYSTDSIIAKNASAKLTEYEKIKLISSAWDSTHKPADSARSEISEIEAVNFARAAIEELYLKHLYPYHFASSYGNWYSWDVSLYQCTETSFHTYTAYCWLVTFYKYNSDEIHEVLISENGTFLSVRTNQPLPENGSTTQTALSYYRNKYEQDSIAVSFLKANDYADIPTYDYTALENPDYFYVYAMVVGNGGVMTFKELDKLSASPSADRLEFYYIYQCSNGRQSAISVIPWE